MDNLFKVIILAIIQGVTEFLPVSSSDTTIGIEPKQAAEYSFLMPAPLLAGASLLTLKAIIENGNTCGGGGLELAIGLSLLFLSFSG